MIEFVKRYKWLLLFINIIVLAFALIIFMGPIKIKKYNSKYFSGKYDSTWKINIQNNTLTFKNGNAKIVCESIELDDEYKYSTINDLYDIIVENIKSQNKSYKILDKAESSITKNDYFGYKMLLESDNKQALLFTFKTLERLIIISYTCPNDKFDILLDSAENIVFNLNVQDDYKFSDKTSKIKFEDISFGKNDELVSKLKSKRKDEIYSNNYHIEYNIPSIFEISNYDSANGNYSYSVNNNNIRVQTKVAKSNVYEQLNRYDKNSDRYNYKSFIDNKQFKNFQSSLSKYGKGYIYKHNYYTSNSIKKGAKNYYEEYTIFYPINKLYTFSIHIESNAKENIPKELIDSITITKVQNYAQHLTCKSQDEKLKCEFKKIINKKDVKALFDISNKYKEVDASSLITTNSYDTKKFTRGYNNKLDMEDYEIEIKLSNLNIDNYINTNKEYTFEKEMTIGNKTFKVYNATSSEISGAMFTSVNRIEYSAHKKILYYEIPDGTICISIRGNDKEITDEIIADFTSFELK